VGRVIGAAVVLLAVFAGVAAAMWPRDDVPRDPDAVVVLGGAGAERFELGHELAERYDAVLVLSSSASHFAAQAGVRCRRDAVCVDPVPETTTGEARTIAAMAEANAWGHVTVATTDFHTARARVLFRQCLGDDVSVVGAPRERSVLSRVRVGAREAIGTAAALTFRRAC
jgi:uncharacterized SAM-binding protein YcdF (DUF218 family)